jgi:hypothetical protein
MAEKHISLQLVKWPYYVGQAIMTVIAVLIAVRADDLSGWTALLCILAAVTGATFIIVPFYLEHRTNLQVYIVDSQTKAAMQRDRFAQWESLFTEQIQRFTSLNTQIEQNMLATEGMVHRADRKLQALELLEGKMDKILTHIVSSDSTFKQQIPPSLKPTQPFSSCPSNKNEIHSIQMDEKIEIKNEFPIAQNSKESTLTSNMDQAQSTQSLDSSQNPTELSPEIEKNLIKLSKQTAEDEVVLQNKEIRSVDFQKTNSEKQSLSTKIGKPGEVLVIVNVMIGLGNKPFIRGTGAGLSWDKGVPMEFLEIGKWSWQTKNDQDWLEFQIFKNDHQADKSIYRLKPGEVIEVVPQFPASEKNEQKFK